MVRTTDEDLSPIEARSIMLEAGLDLIDQGFSLFDSELKLVAANRTFARLLGFPESMVRIGTPFEAFIRYNAERGEYGEGDIDELIAERVRIAKLFKPHYLERVRPNRQVIAVRGEPLPNLGFITIYTDITAQREAERLIRERNSELEMRVQERTQELEAAYQRLRAINQVNQQIAADLRRSEERLRLITDAIPARIAYIDKDGIYRFANRGYVEWFNRTKELLIGQHVREVLGSALYADIGPHIERAMAGEAMSFEYATAVNMKQGGSEIRHAHSDLVPELSAQGAVQGIFVLSTDITEQKRAQATLMHAQKMEAVGQLAGGIAHDLNNMLTVVLGNLAALEERMRDSREAADLVEPALLATRRGASLIKRLMTFSQQQPLEPSPVDVPALIKGINTLLRRTLPENIALSLRFADKLAYAMTDSHQLENALLNLALNSRDAMPLGGELVLHAEMQVASRKSASRLGVQPGNYVRITVADTGSGMENETLERACEPFFTTKRFGSGSGLGLSMVYGFAQQSKGALSIRSASGKGTRVSLLLPATDQPPVTEQEAAAGAKSANRNRLVLLVEDDPGVRQVVRRQLLELGHAVVEAANGHEALTMINQVKEIEIVLSDVVMPGGIDGPALARGVRSLRSEVAILLMSGYEQKSGGAGEFKLLGKPFTKTDLAAALAKLAP
jgi:PAS domain S-box-containing protein